MREGGATLTSGCNLDSEVIAEIPSGTELTIRYSLSGQRSPCFKVAALIAGKSAEGFLPASAIDGLEEFERSRRSASTISANASAVSSKSREFPVPKGATPPASAGYRVSSEELKALHQADAMVDAGQPARALAFLESSLKTNRDAATLTAAGVAAWRSDDIQKALRYWQESLKLQPDAQLQELYNRVEREADNDRSGQRMAGMRVMLRYEGTSISADTAREMVAVIDQEVGRIVAQLGCGGGERINAIAMSRESYYKTTGAAEWSGGQFDGRIHVPVFEKGGLDARTRQTLAHESVHACMSMLGEFPTWLSEGVAQRLSGEVLTPSMRALIAEMGQQKQLPPLDQLGQNWSALDTASARIAYALALRAVELFEQDFAAVGLRNLLKNPQRIPQISAELDKRLRM